MRRGDLVQVRRTRWRVVQVRAFDGCHLVTLRGLSAPHVGVDRRVLAPFDTVEPIRRLRRPRFVRPVLWRRACRALISADLPAGSLCTARSAAIDVMPHQLSPALAIVRGKATRLLLADEVGLGKTIQAGLIASELLARGEVERVLVLTPAGLRDQWIQELARRFALGAVAVDARMLRRLTPSLPVGMNPWLTFSAAVASIDYVKRAEVLPAVGACRWDLVIVDEAHGVAEDSDRRAAVHAIASRATFVLLLSATPHNGDRRAFASLCGIGAVDDTPLLVFRRTRAQVGIGTARRIHAVRIEPSGDELRMHAILLRYSRAVRSERRRDERGVLLALSVLHKRALSSAWSLAQSVGRRLERLSSGAADRGAEQLGLPLGDSDGEQIDADAPPAWPTDLHLADAARERRLLEALLVASRAAIGSETKLRRLQTLLRRTAESAVVFTEYRDTLMHVRGRLSQPVVVLHGGLGREERAAALDEFMRAPGTVLLATDAAAEGLNLQHRCRIVINLELPWNPMRLEQRIGRVDRIGQRLTVHAFHLIARRTGEARILERLRARLAEANLDIAVSNPLGTDDEHATARLIIAGGPEDADNHHRPRIRRPR